MPVLSMPTVQQKLQWLYRQLPWQMDVGDSQTPANRYKVDSPTFIIDEEGKKF